MASGTIGKPGADRRREDDPGNGGEETRDDVHGNLEYRDPDSSEPRCLEVVTDQVHPAKQAAGR